MEMELKNLKAEYDKLQKKYNMPLFAELNGAFEIEKIDRESDILLRLVRKIMIEKIVNLLSLSEIFLTPNNIPRMYLTYLKMMTAEDKKQVTEIYDGLSKLVIETMPLEMEYNEKAEAEVISKMYNKWSELKPQIKLFFVRLGSPIQKSQGKERSYFG
jgi:hypothetical protein